MSEPLIEEHEDEETPEAPEEGDGTADAPEHADEETGDEPDTDEPAAPPGPATVRDTDEEQPHPEPGPEAQMLTPQELEKRSRSAETRFATYEKGIRNLYDAEAEYLLECPLCPTQHKGFVDVRFAGRIPDDVADATKFYLGVARQEEYPQDPGTNMCPTCEGLTKVKTGARAGSHMERTCPNCLGYGFMPPPAKERAHVASNGAVDEAVLAAIEDMPREDVDSWGEPKILPDGTVNDNYGKMPQFKQLHPKYGVTANLVLHEVAS